MLEDGAIARLFRLTKRESLGTENKVVVAAAELVLLSLDRGGEYAVSYDAMNGLETALMTLAREEQ